MSTAVSDYWSFTGEITFVNEVRLQDSKVFSFHQKVIKTRKMGFSPFYTKLKNSLFLFKQQKYSRVKQVAKGEISLQSVNPPRTSCAAAPGFISSDCLFTGNPTGE